MLVGLEQTIDFWGDHQSPDTHLCCSEELVAELQSLATNGRDAAELSAVVYELLRKHMGKPLGREILGGIQNLAQGGDPAGARLLGAMLEVAAPAQRLLPLVQNMSSSRRLWLGRLMEDSHPGCVLAEWTRKLQDLSVICADLLAKQQLAATIPRGRVGWEEPWGALRTVIGVLIRHALSGGTLSPESRQILADLLRLEIDAWQERISNLAGSIDPFRVAAISRVLPILSRADAEIRDLRHLVQLITEGNDEDAFTRPRLRALEVLEERELLSLNKILGSVPGLKPLAAAFRLQQENPLPVPIIAYGVARLLAMDRVLQEVGQRQGVLDLIDACQLVLGTHSQGEVALSVPRELLPTVETALQGARGPRQRGTGPECWSLGGVELLVGQLIVILPESLTALARWPHFLPTPDDPDPLYTEADLTSSAKDEDTKAAPEEKPPEDMNTSAMKNLVLTNIQSTSLVLGFLRNPKFVSIPGLVEAVATRSRNPRIIEVVAADRTLHTGFANRGVPLACLRSPVNVSVKTLRKFIHVKYISKMDLKRLALDKAGIRKEVIREIEKYLTALA